jgi:hypothetical protein
VPFAERLRGRLAAVVVGDRSRIGGCRRRCIRDHDDTSIALARGFGWINHYGCVRVNHYGCVRTKRIGGAIGASTVWDRLD